MYAINFTKIIERGIETADPNWPRAPCKHGWEFDLDEIRYSTISTEVKNLNYYLLGKILFVLPKLKMQRGQIRTFGMGLRQRCATIDRAINILLRSDFRRAVVWKNR